MRRTFIRADQLATISVATSNHLDRQRVDEVLALGLTDVAHRRVKTFSLA